MFIFIIEKSLSLKGSYGLLLNLNKCPQLRFIIFYKIFKDKNTVFYSLFKK